MQINHLVINNLKVFKLQKFSFHPQMNLIVSANGTGKTSLLDALSIAASSWLLGFNGCKARPIHIQDVRIAHLIAGNIGYQYPCTVDAMGKIGGDDLEWGCSFNKAKGRTTYIRSKEIKDLSIIANKSVSDGGDNILPLLSYYGSGRLGNISDEQSIVRCVDELVFKTSRLRGYYGGMDPNLSMVDLTHWIAKKQWVMFQNGELDNTLFSIVQNAIVNCVGNIDDLCFDSDRGEIIADTNNQGSLPFNSLSDGQRGMFAMVGDMAIRAAMLNPHLGGDVLEKTPGIVLIDGVDPHIHPKWQRRIIEDLRKTFPMIQFFITTHSPFIIQSLRPDDNLIVLDRK